MNFFYSFCLVYVQSIYDLEGIRRTKRFWSFGNVTAILLQPRLSASWTSGMSDLRKEKAYSEKKVTINPLDGFIIVLIGSMIQCSL